MMKTAKTGLLGLSIFMLSGAVAQAASSSFGDDYTAFKNQLNKEYGFDYNLTYSVLGQRTSPSGRYNAVQSNLSPAITWTNFDNKYGTGALNISYDSVFYGRHNAVDLQNRSGIASPINDFDDSIQEFSGLYYTYELPGEYNWLLIGAGQYPIYLFDGTTYDSNQQVNFLNYALSQNGSSSYSTAGVGFYIEATPGKWSFAAGAQDASNISATSVRVNRIHDKHYTTFGSIGYNPSFKHLGDGQYAVMVYNQPGVKEQPQSTTGWSVNMQQNIGEKLSIFGRVNGVSGSMMTINQSYVAGMVYNNPLNRNSLDQIGLAYAYNKIDESAVGAETYHKAEQVIETYWAWGFSKWATLTPDFQFYIHPALNRKSDYGTATSIRLTLFF